MKQKSTKQRELETEYKKERSRITRSVRQLKKQGFELSFETPKKPKKITEASIEKLKKITSRTITDKATMKATIINKQTGEVTNSGTITATQYKNYRRMKTVHVEEGYEVPDDLPDESEMAMKAILSAILEFANSYHKLGLSLHEKITDLIEEYGYSLTYKAILHEYDGSVESLLDELLRLVYYYPSKDAAEIICNRLILVIQMILRDNGKDEEADELENDLKEAEKINSLMNTDNNWEELAVDIWDMI